MHPIIYPACKLLDFDFSIYMAKTAFRVWKDRAPKNFVTQIFYIYDQKSACGMEHPVMRKLQKGIFLYIHRKVAIEYGTSSIQISLRELFSIYIMKSALRVWKIRHSIYLRKLFPIYIAKTAFRVWKNGPLTPSPWAKKWSLDSVPRDQNAW